MSEELKIKEYTIDDMKEYIRRHEYLSQQILTYEGTNLNQANIIFNEILDKKEMDMLYELLLSKEGWYKKINGEGCIKLKLVAAALGFTHNKIHRNNIPIEKIEQIQKNISIEEQMLIASCYIKQKIITKKTLINYQEYVNTKNKIAIKDNKVTLYRGIKGDFDIYKTISLESWSTQLNIAKQFSGSNGIIFKDKIDIDDILCCRKTTFRHPNKPNIYQSKPIRGEHEYIVESIDDNKVLNRYQ